MKPVRVFVQTDQIDDRTITTKTGSSIRLRQQNAYLYGRSELGLVEFKCEIPESKGAYPVGVYEMAGGSFEVGDYGRIRVGFGGVSLVRCSDDDEHAMTCLRMVDMLVGAHASHGIEIGAPASTKRK